MEEILGASPLDWTSVRATRISDDPPAGQLRVGDGATPPGGTTVGRDELASFVVGEITTREWLNRTPTLARRMPDQRSETSHPG